MKLDDAVCVFVDNFWFGGQIIEINESEGNAVVEYLNNERKIQTVTKPLNELKQAFNGTQQLQKSQEILALWSNDDDGRYCIAFYEAVLTSTPDLSKSYIAKCKFKREAKERFVDVRSVFLV